MLFLERILRGGTIEVRISELIHILAEPMHAQKGMKSKYKGTLV